MGPNTTTRLRADTCSSSRCPLQLLFTSLLPCVPPCGRSSSAGQQHTTSRKHCHLPCPARVQCSLAMLLFHLPITAKDVFTHCTPSRLACGKQAELWPRQPAPSINCGLGCYGLEPWAGSNSCSACMGHKPCGQPVAVLSLHTGVQGVLLLVACGEKRRAATAQGLRPTADSG